MFCKLAFNLRRKENVTHFFAENTQNHLEVNSFTSIRKQRGITPRTSPLVVEGPLNQWAFRLKENGPQESKIYFFENLPSH
jgi:hypothetical protein